MTDQTQTTTEPVLLPCPFCGGEAWLNDYEAKHSDLPPHSRAPQCRSCGVSPGYLPTTKKAIAAWNTRTTPQPLAIGLDREAVARVKLRNPFDQFQTVGDFLHSEIIDDIVAALALAAPAEGWQGIETAPKDGTEVLVMLAPKVIRLGWYFKRSSRTEGWCDENGKAINPTHWMPLPAAPTGETL